MIGNSWVGSCPIWYNAIKTSSSGNKREQKRQTAEQLWQKNGNCLFADANAKKLGIVQRVHNKGVTMKKIAIIEDETAIRENYMEMLSAQGYSVSGYSDRQSAECAFNDALPDLAIVDIGLGHEIDGGFLLCQTLRSLSKTLPIIFLTARDSEIDTVCGLRMGADDYLTKDISMAHLAARIGALFRRMEALEQPADQNALINRGPLTLDTQRMQVFWQQQLVDLTVTEFWMLHSLAQRPGHVKSRHELMSDAKIYVDDSTITSHVKRIRKKFIALDTNFDCIDTVYGMGYRWEQI